MAESITISKLPPPFESMQYASLRQQGLQHLQQLSGDIWTDFNAHDPGVTLLELLSYAITDLGYRTNYNIRDILKPAPNLPQDIRNFFAAKEIMPNYPVTLNDYRKLLIDVEIPVTDVSPCESVGIKNAWIQKSTENEINYYVDLAKKTLNYSVPTPPVDRQQPEVLYDILLEFNECEALGDLNENTLDGKLKLYLFSAVPIGVSQIPADLNGIDIRLEVEFPRWDTTGVDWDNPLAIKALTKNLVLKFIRLPEKYTVESYGMVNGNVFLTMFTGLITPVDTTGIVFQIEDYLYRTVDALVMLYQKKVKHILEILVATKKRLMANRNLGEDFFRFSAIKVEEILLCADVEVTNDAVIELVQAQIYHEIERFLSPTVFFYSLSEMYAKGKTTDEIFEGPLLEHGFIDDAELVKADRRNVLHVSDLISIIMDIPGVLAVKSIQVANLPLDNDDNILSHAVKWCLALAIDKNYVPRLSTDRSRLTFFKGQLPYRANEVKVQELLDQLEAADRPQKLVNPDYDIHIEEGEFKDIENYYSIQEELPVVYGAGTPGLPASASVERRAQAKQLKAFMIFFEQLLADYLSQLSHVKDLFSMNDGKDINGDPVINKTYFTQSLMNAVPDGLPLFVNESNPQQYEENLQRFAESPETYEQRRNRFLDHLMARFAESFSDYALVVYKIDGPKAPSELIEDKLAFLNNYPLISSARDTAFNYKSPCKLWHIDNISGLERRASYLCGVDKPLPSLLWFSYQFNILAGMTPDTYYAEIYDTGLAPMLYSPNGTTGIYPSIDAAKAAIELIIVNGAQPEKYFVYDSLGALVPNPQDNPFGYTAPYTYRIICDGDLLAESIPFALLARTNPLDPPDPTTYLVDSINYESLPLMRGELLNNPEANRYSLDCFMDKYVQTTLLPPAPPVPPCPTVYIFQYALTDAAPIPKTLLTGEVKGLEQEFDPPVPVVDQANNNKERLLMDMLRAASDIANYRYGFDPSDPTMEVFTVVDRCGDVVGTSFEEDFNQHIQDQLTAIQGMTPPDNKLFIGASTGNNGFYTTSSVTIDLTNARRLILTMNEPLPSAIGDGDIRYVVDTLRPTLLPNVIDANIAENYFEVDKSLSRILFPGERIVVSTSPPGPDDGDYHVVKVVPIGLTNSLVYVKERIPDTTPGAAVLQYMKTLPIVAVDQSTNQVFIEPGADAVAAQELADFVKLKFFSHEGMHVLEHILLRPKYNSTAYEPVDTDNGLKTTTTLGTLTFLRNFATYTVTQVARQFTVTGDFVSELPVFAKIKILGSTNAGTYTVRSAVLTAGDTVITIYDTIPDTTNDGTLQFSAMKAITSVVDFDTLEITDTETTRHYTYPAISTDVIITGSGNTTDDDLGINDGVYKILAPALPVGNVVTIELTEKKVAVRDSFLPIDTDNDCLLCRSDAPYSYIVTVVLPAWQGRFVQQDFRSFFDRTLRLECPAHLVLNICWIDCKQMGEFEERYKTWLLENVKENKDQAALTAALNELIELLVKLRSVYPEGVLHDCESDPEAENAIILNNTIIGTL